MKKILVMLFVMLSVVTFAAQPTKECLIIQLNGVVIQGVEAKDEKGSPYIHADFVPFHETAVLYVSKPTYTKYCHIYYAVLSKNANGQKSVAGSAPTLFSPIVINVKENATNGYIAFEIGLKGKGVGTTSLRCYCAGESENEWLESEKRYILKSASGTFVGNSYSRTAAIFDFMALAIPSIQTKQLPAWGTFTIEYGGYLTDKEIIDLISK